MAIFRKFCIFDFETDGTNPDVCEPVQLAAVIINPYKLEIVPDSQFQIVMQPPLLAESVDKDIQQQYIDSHMDTIAWHANNYHVKPEEIIERWKNGTEQSRAWQLFVQYCMLHNPKQNMGTAVVPGGANIRRFDLRIIDRLKDKYNTKKWLFWPRDVLDIQDLAFYWFESLREPRSYNMDTLRQFLGLSTAGGHDAMKDVLDTTQMIIRFLKFMRNIAQNQKFKGSFKPQK